MPFDSQDKQAPELENVLSDLYQGAYKQGQAEEEPTTFMAFSQKQEALDKEARREEERKQNDFARSQKRSIMTTFLILIIIITVGGLIAYFRAPSADDRKAGIAATLASLSAIGGLAAGLGLR
jgi:hypothetical protein